MRRIRWAAAFMALVLFAIPALAQEENLPLEETEAPAETPLAEAEETGAPAETPLAEAEETGAPAETPRAEAEETAAETPAGRVARASFTSGIIDREPMDSISSLSNDHSEIVFFTELRDLEGQAISHVWAREGAEMARVPFAVNGPRWRVYSTKNLEPSWTGAWTVRVEDESGRVLHTESFSYVPVAAEADAAESVVEEAIVEEAIDAQATPSSEEPPAGTEELPASIIPE